VESTSPSSGARGGTENVTVKGTNFAGGAIASFGNEVKVNSTTFKNASELTANITIESGPGTGPRTVTVTNLDAGTGSLAEGFTVPAKPSVSSTSPSSRGQGATNQEVNITGSGFVSGASLASSFGAGITVNSTTVKSSTEVVANITIEAGAATGSRTVTVTNG